MTRKPCTVEGCAELKKPAHPSLCYWHWLAKQSPDAQTSESKKRLRAAENDRGYLRRARVPADEWPDGQRWCASCQAFIPLHYVSGSRCKGCESRANHGGHVQRAYGLAQEEYEALLTWQGGRCFICQQRPVSRRLAVDHDHVSGAVRGLLCADNERGCNSVVIGALEGRRGIELLEMARRIVLYFEQFPINRMRAGEAPPRLPRKPGVLDIMKADVRRSLDAQRPVTGGAQWPAGFEPLS